MHQTHAHDYSLIQVGTTPYPTEWNITLLNSLDLEYMGSAEFEGGAVASALVRFIACPEAKVSGWMKHTLRTGEKVNIKVIARRSQLPAVMALLDRWDLAQLDLHETCPLDNPNMFHIGIDEGHEFFMWRGYRGMRLIRTTFMASVAVLRKNPRYTEALAEIPEGISLAELFKGRTV